LEICSHALKATHNLPPTRDSHLTANTATRTAQQGTFLPLQSAEMQVIQTPFMMQPTLRFSKRTTEGQIAKT